MDKIKSEIMSSSGNSPRYSKNTISKTNKSPSSQSKHRRSRSDNHKREYLCGCGKSYLSAAALYTHVKQKHDGVAPQGSQQPSTQNPRNKIKNEFLSKEDISDPKEPQKIGQNLAHSIYDEITAFFSNFYEEEENTNSQEGFQWISTEFPTSLFKNKQDYKGLNDNLDLLAQRITNYLPPPSAQPTDKAPSIFEKSETQLISKAAREEEECFSESNFSVNPATKVAQKAKKQQEMDGYQEQDEICNKQNNHLEQNGKNNQSTWILDYYDSQRGLRITNINNIFAIFAANLSLKISRQALKEVLIFLALLRKTLNIYGWRMCQSPLPFKLENKVAQSQQQVKIENEDHELVNEEKQQQYKQYLSEEQTNLDQHQNKENSKHQEEFCANNCGENIAEIANLFIHFCKEKLFSQILITEWSSSLKILGEDEEGLKNICHILRLLLQWMEELKFANSFLEFNKEEDIKQPIDCQEKPAFLEEEVRQQEEEKKQEEQISEVKHMDFEEDPIDKEEQVHKQEKEAMIATLNSGFSHQQNSEKPQLLCSQFPLIQNKYDFIYDQQQPYLYNNGNSSTSFFNQYNYCGINNSFIPSMPHDLFRLNSTEFPLLSGGASSTSFMKPNNFSLFNQVTPTYSNQQQVSVNFLSPLSGYNFCNQQALQEFRIQQQLYQQQQLHQQQINILQQEQQQLKQLNMQQQDFPSQGQIEFM